LIHSAYTKIVNEYSSNTCDHVRVEKEKMFNVAINGYGRIGQSVLRAIYSTPFRSKFRIVAINELADIDIPHPIRYNPWSFSLSPAF
jgi:lactate dehydrogenase-like 2-hydroxyacid dehydrogenase